MGPRPAHPALGTLGSHARATAVRVIAPSARCPSCWEWNLRWPSAP